MIRTQSTMRASLLAGVALSAASTAALAQSAVDTGSGSSQLEELVVTAQRREERLQDVPVAISAFGEKQLQQAGVESTAELAKVTPGFNFARSGFGVQPTIRGIGTRGTGAGDESVVPVYVDGIYQPFLQAGVMDLPDIERVEILRGPQGALYGRNATGGAINIVTRKPSSDPTAEVTLGYGRFDERRLRAYASAGTERVQASVTVSHVRDDGYVHDLVRNASSGKANNTTVRGKLAFQPADNLEFTLHGAYAHNFDNSILMSQPINGNTSARRLDPTAILASRPYEVAQSFEPFLKILTNNLALTGTWRTGAFDLTNVTSYFYGRMADASDSDAAPPRAQGSTLIYQNSRSLYQELYATSKSAGPIDWVVGGVYFHDLSKADPSQSEQSNLTAGPNFGVISYINNYAKIQTNAYAAYAQATWRFAPAWSATVGARYSRETKDFSGRQVTLNTRTGAAATIVKPRASKTWEKLTPTGTLTFKPRDNVNLYLRAGEGFKSGIWNPNSLDNPAVNPENVTQYELGAKLDPLPWLRANVAVYHTKAKDLQTSARDPVTNLIFQLNAAEAKIDGVEVELAAQPTAALSLWSSLSLQRAKYASFPGAPVTFPFTTNNPTPAATCAPGTGTPLGGNRSAVCDATGNKLIRTPNVTFNIGGDYTTSLAGGELVVGGNAYYAGKSYADVGNKLAYDPYWDLSAQASWTPDGSNVTLGIWGENLTNELRYISRLTSGTADVQVPARPRSYGVRVTMKFGAAAQR